MVMVMMMKKMMAGEGWWTGGGETARDAEWHGIKLVSSRCTCHSAQAEREGCNESILAEGAV